MRQRLPAFAGVGREPETGVALGTGNLLLGFRAEKVQKGFEGKGKLNVDAFW